MRFDSSWNRQTPRLFLKRLFSRIFLFLVNNVDRTFPLQSLGRLFKRLFLNFVDFRLNVLNFKWIVAEGT